MKNPGFVLSALLALALCGCATQKAAQENTQSETTVPSTAPEAKAVNTQPAAGADNLLEDAGLPAPATGADGSIDLARQDLAGRLKLDAGLINTLKVTEITWPDISQGCVGGAGEKLTKGRLNGYRVWLQANGTDYVYHVGLDGRLVFCTN